MSKLEKIQSEYITILEERLREATASLDADDRYGEYKDEALRLKGEIESFAFDAFLEEEKQNRSKVPKVVFVKFKDKHALECTISRHNVNLTVSGKAENFDEDESIATLFYGEYGMSEDVKLKVLSKSYCEESDSTAVIFKISQQRKIITFYSNGFKTKLLNRKIYAKEIDGGFSFTFYTLDDKPDAPACLHEVVRGKIRSTSIKMSHESLRAMMTSLAKYDIAKNGAGISEK